MDNAPKNRKIAGPTSPDSSPLAIRRIFTAIAENKWLVAGIIVPLILVLDQWSKWKVLKSFYLHETQIVIKNFFNLTYIQNTGAAFGMLADSHPEFRVPFFYVVPTVALGIIAYLFYRAEKNNWYLTTSLSLIFSGALGNIADRIQHGFVVDFLHFHWMEKYYFAAFNIADSAICVGVGLMLLDAFFQAKADRLKT